MARRKGKMHPSSPHYRPPSNPDIRNWRPTWVVPKRLRTISTLVAPDVLAELANEAQRLTRIRGGPTDERFVVAQLLTAWARARIKRRSEG